MDGLKLLNEWARTNQGRFHIERFWPTYDDLELRVTAVSHDMRKYVSFQMMNVSRAFDFEEEVAVRLNYMAIQVVHEMWKTPETA